MTTLRLLKANSEEEAPREQEMRSELASLFEQARRGELPRSRELLAHEPILLNERHLQAIMMRVMGMRQCDIARALDYTDSTVSIILNHPDSQYILDRIQAMSGVQVADIDARLQRLNEKAVDAIEDLFDASEMKEAQLASLKARAGFSLLERNLGKKKTVEHNHAHRLEVSAESASIISRALSEARLVEAEVVSFTPVGAVGQLGPAPAVPLEVGPPPVDAPQGPS
jgi:transcriptional regulator